jgi:mannitol-1-phosphate 5-dehydrogenase
LVEPFFEWVIDQTRIKGVQPIIEGALFVEDLSAYIERKLFTVNTGHAATAYLGNVKGFHTIAETIEDPEVKQSVLAALEETGIVLIEKYGFDKEQHLQYIQKIIGRFSNPFIVDEVSRVGRSPIRKLGSNDRLVAPALAYMNLFNRVPERLVEVMAAALAFYSVDDQESIELKNAIVEKGIRRAFSDVSNLEMDHELVKKVTEVFETLKS